MIILISWFARIVGPNEFGLFCLALIENEDLPISKYCSKTHCAHKIKKRKDVGFKLLQSFSQKYIDVHEVQVAQCY